MSLPVTLQASFLGQVSYDHLKPLLCWQEKCHFEERSGTKISQNCLVLLKLPCNAFLGKISQCVCNCKYLSNNLTICIKLGAYPFEWSTRGNGKEVGSYLTPKDQTKLVIFYGTNALAYSGKAQFTTEKSFIRVCAH